MLYVWGERIHFVSNCKCIKMYSIEKNIFEICQEWSLIFCFYLCSTFFCYTLHILILMETISKSTKSLILLYSFRSLLKYRWKNLPIILYWTEKEILSARNINISKSCRKSFRTHCAYYEFPDLFSTLVIHLSYC